MMWSMTLMNDKFTTFPKMEDPFGNVFGDVITFTMPILNQGKAGQA